MNAVLLRSPDEEVRRAGVAALRGGAEELELLVEALGDVSWRVRKEAVMRAASWDDRDAAAAALVQALAEPDNVGRRNAAVEALARIGGPAVGPLVAALPARPEHRKLIADTLGLIGDRRGAEPIVPLLEDEDENVRAATAESLGRIGGAVAEAALLRALERDQLLVSIACLEALSGMGAALPLSRLEPLLAVPVQRPAVLAAVGGTRDPAAAGLLAGYLTDRSRSVREAAMVALDRLIHSLEDGPRAQVAQALRELHEDARRELVEALIEATPGTRRAAATVLGRSGLPQAVRPLVLALGDPDVEEAAASALLALDAEAVGPLVELLREVEPAARQAILRLVPRLASAHDPSLREAVRAAAQDEEADVACEALRALGAVGGEEAISVVLRALEREELSAAAEEALAGLSERCPDALRAAILARGFEGEEARHLCLALGGCGHPEDAAVLDRLLRHDEPALRSAAAEALAQLLGEPAFGRLKGALLDVSPEVRAAVARAVSGWPSGRHALTDRQATEEDPLVRAVIAAALARPA